jgi:lipopolysaccharide/colanic/teichoic acid biosynthesis glycosyltransferase
MIVEGYQPWQRKRFAVPPGMTGWWQVHGRSQQPLHMRTEDDLYYIQNYSLLLDLSILWKTIGAVITGRGAY